VLVRDVAAHRHPFAAGASYLAPMERGLAAGGTPFSELGMDLSRGFRALKVWMSFKEHGIERYGELVEQNMAQAQYLAGLVDAHPELERAAPVPTNIVNFRYVVPAATEQTLNELNREIVMRLHESGIAVPSFTVLQGRFVIRVAITNHRTRREDFDVLVDAVVRLGRAAMAQGATE
jgi:aromatic-L-amino-acid/L-tryptophan decarboxylase